MVAITRDNKKVVTVSLDKTSKIWDINTGICIFTLTGHTDGI